MELAFKITTRRLILKDRKRFSLPMKAWLPEFGMTRFRVRGLGEEAAGRRMEVFLEKKFFTGGPPLLPLLFQKARVIPKKKKPSLRGFDD